MSRISSFDDLSEALTNDFTWRLREISSVKKITKDLGKPDEAPLARAALALVYAHWEGYIKFSAEKYLEFVSSKRVKYGELSDNFLFLGNLQNLKRLQSGSGSIKSRIEVLNSILESAVGVNRSRHRNVINTRSNLSAEVLQEICEVIGLDGSSYEEYSDFIDKRILARRKHIAHGREILLSVEELDECANRVLEIMRTFRTEIENCALLEKFRKSPRPSS